MMLIRIEDPRDPRIEGYREIRERDLVGRQGLFVAEGRVVLEKAVASGCHPILSALIAERRVESMEPVLRGLDPWTPVYVAAQSVIDAIAGFPLHRGILALGRRAAREVEPLLATLPERAVVLALAGIANHDNMGGAFRNAAAFGVDAVVLDDACCDPLYRKAIRVSVGAALTVPFARAGAPTQLEAILTAHGFEVLALTPKGLVDISDLAPSAGRIAALIGAEGPGLPLDRLNAMTVRIGMAEGFDSLNLATASGIFLHHVFASTGARRAAVLPS